jgi:hypothetical protein
VAYFGESAPCYQSTDWVWFLSVRPGDSYLAYGSSSRAGTVFFDFVRTQPSFDLTYAPVLDADARQVLQTIWWLSKVRSKARGEGPFGAMGSTADGSGRLTIRSIAGATLADAQGTVWAGDCASRWTGDYGSDELLNLAAPVVERVLPARLGRAWRRPAGCAGGVCRRREGANDSHTRDFVKRDAERILDRFKPAEQGVPPALASLAVATLADIGIRQMAEPFERLLMQLPGRDPSVGNVSAAESRLQSTLQPGKDRDGSDPMASLEEMQAAVREYERLRQGSDDAAGRERLRTALQLAIRQLRTADDVSALEQWAVTEDPGWRFALSRLHELDRKTYVRVLEAWLKRSKDESRRQVFTAIAEADPGRARELAQAAGPASDLAVSSFGVLARAQAIPDRTERIAALVALMDDKQADWQERIRAIEVLAPEDDPLRFDAKAIDEALVPRLAPSPDDRDGAYVVGPAARALARRGRVDAFDHLLKAWNDSEGRDMSLAPGEVAGALVQLLPRGGPRERELLVDAFRSRLHSTHGFLSEMILEIWAAELRELLPDLERVATSSPEDVEGEDGSSWRGGPPRPVVDRFHMARKVAAIWNEDDPYTRARLLLAFGRREPILSSPEGEAQTKRALAAAASSLADAPANQRRLREFLRLIDTSAGQEPDWAEQAERLSRLTREAFGWSSAQ